MFDPPIDNWTQADEDCYDCKHRLDLGDRLAYLTAENARLQGAEQAVLRLLARVQAADALAEALEQQFKQPIWMLALSAALAAYRATEVQP